MTNSNCHPEVSRVRSAATIPGSTSDSQTLADVSDDDAETFGDWHGTATVTRMSRLPA